MHPQLETLIKCIDLEEKEQSQRYKLDQQHSLKTLKAEGLALHPIIVTKRTFGYAEYPEIAFKLAFPPESNLFRDGSAIECFVNGEEPVKGVLLNLEGRVGEFRLFAPDFPDWIEDDGVGIKLSPDTRTSEIMKRSLMSIEKNNTVFELFKQLHGEHSITEQQISSNENPVWHNKNLNESQQQAVKAMLGNDQITVIHGPPGTGKTTTLSEGIFQLAKIRGKIIVSAPSNTAVDNICKNLINLGLTVLRVGNTSKVDDKIFAHTPEGKLANSRQQKDIKQLKIRAEEFRKMALKYKRSFGKAEREQRNLLFKEVKNIREEIKKLQHYNEEKLYEQAEVIAGTPVGLYDAKLNKYNFAALVIDEAGQCIEPLAWCIIPLSSRIILAGDHWQLPPTVLSMEAAKCGLNVSILERAISTVPSIYLLNVQYRMRPVISGFSSNYFYNDLLLTAAHLLNDDTHFTFIDTAGSGFNESRGPEGTSLQNEGELKVIRELLNSISADRENIAVISPYSGQVTASREMFQQTIRSSTIDSFQGQEKEVIIISLVRSNDENEIGFLKDYRRMNVALTRAKDKLFVIGDSATIGADPFFNALLLYIERWGDYRSVWEFEL